MDPIEELAKQDSREERPEMDEIRAELASWNMDGYRPTVWENGQMYYVTD